jgi:alpha-mannosidase
MLVRGFNGMGYITNHPRPQTPDYLDIRTPPLSTVILTGGLPFHQKQGGRMADVILVPEGEKTTVFEMGIAFDREVPMQTAWGYASPLAIVPTTKGPPHIGASGWLFHVDASNLLLTRLTPGLMNGRAEPAADGAEDAITARFLECANYSGLAEFRCVRDPQRATVLDARGQFLVEANRSGDVVHLEVTPNDLAHVQVEFSVPVEPGS